MCYVAVCFLKTYDLLLNKIVGALNKSGLKMNYILNYYNLYTSNLNGNNK